jgi:hypothetical protein
MILKRVSLKKQKKSLNGFLAKPLLFNKELFSESRSLLKALQAPFINFVFTVP